jgi:hypothetical protein
MRATLILTVLAMLVLLSTVARSDGGSAQPLPTIDPSVPPPLTDTPIVAVTSTSPSPEASVSPADTATSAPPTPTMVDTWHALYAPYALDNLARVP